MRHAAIVIAGVLTLGLSPAFAAGTTTTGTQTTPGATTTTGNGAGSSATRSLSGTSAGPMSEGQVKQKLEQQGYSDVTNLKEESNGTWMGQATKGGRQMTIDVQPDGTVTAK